MGVRWKAFRGAERPDDRYGMVVGFEEYGMWVSWKRSACEVTTSLGLKRRIKELWELH